MKRKIFSIMAIAAIALTSCKKDEPATSELGEATINGNVWADMDLTDMDVEGVQGMQVRIEVNSSSFVQNPVAGYDYEVKNYVTTTDANGDYTLVIPTTEDGFSVDVEFADLYTTRTSVSGTDDVKVTRADLSFFVYSGAIIATQDEGTVTSASQDISGSGTATIFGSIYAQQNEASWNNPIVADQKLTAASGLGAQDVIWSYSSAPYGGSTSGSWNVAVNLTDGTYTMEIPTEGLSGTAVDVEFGMLDFFGDHVRNNMAFTADSTESGVWSCGGITVNTETLNAGDIVPDADITLSFTPF